MAEGNIKSLQESPFYFSSLVIIPTYDCNSKCRHCYPNCEPKVRNGWDEALVRKAIDLGSEIPETNLARNMHIAGGEPFLYFDKLLESFRYSKKRGFFSSVVTNGFWATSDEKAENMVRQLIEAGLIRVEISIDRFHQEFIPLKNVRIALRAFRKFNSQIIIRVSTTQKNDAYSAIEGIPPEELVGTRLGATPVSPEGRALEAIEADDFIYANHINGCCSHMLNLGVRFDGNVSPCCAGSDTHPLLSLGNIEEDSLAEIINRLKYKFHLVALFEKGPKELIKVLKAGGLEKNLLEKYTMICHACAHIFSNKENTEYLEEYYRKQKAQELSSMLSDLIMVKGEPG